MNNIQLRRSLPLAAPLALPAYVHIDAGIFTMGSDEPGAGEGPAGPVWVSSFWCARTATSNREFEKFVEATGYRTTAERRAEANTWRTFATSDRTEHPVVMLSWNDAVAYADWLTSVMGIRFRIPTEAEWEKAARGKLDGAEYPWGSEAPDAVGGNFGSIGRANIPRTVPVAALPQNGFGLFFGGNVWEWVQDWYDPHAYSRDLRRDPRGPTNGVERCRRGGAYNNRRGFRLRVSSRNRLEPDATFRNMGLRLVCETNPASSGIPVRWKYAEWTPRLVSTQTLSMSEATWDEALRSAIRVCFGLRERVEAALNVLRPNMEEDRGGVEIVRADNGVVELELVGTCRSCPKSDMTFADLSETLLRHIPELHRISRVGC